MLKKMPLDLFSSKFQIIIKKKFSFDILLHSKYDQSFMLTYLILLKKCSILHRENFEIAFVMLE